MLRAIFPAGLHRPSFRKKLRESDHESNEPQPVPHALDTLPTLGQPRRPITPPHVTANPQTTSPFFKLPPEIRIEIIRLLLPHREIHLDMRYSKTETTTPHSTRGAYMEMDRRWQWRANTCHRHPSASPLFDKCTWGGPPPTACDQFDTPCGIGSETMSMLLSCRLAYREVVHVLYAENTFHSSTGALLLFTDRLLPRERTASMTSFVYHARTESLDEYAAEHLGLEKPGWSAYEVLLGRIPVAFPSLRRLTVIFPCRDGMGLLKVVEGEDGDAVSSNDDGGGQDTMRKRITAPMDAVVAAFGPSLEVCSLLVDETAFDAHFSRSVYDTQDQNQGQMNYLSGWWGEGTRAPTMRCIWRRLGDDDSEVGNATGIGEEGAPGTGYWVRGVSQADNYIPKDRWGVFP